MKFQRKGKNNGVSLALGRREDEDILNGKDFTQKDSYKTKNNLEKRETISEIEIDEISEEN